MQKKSFSAPILELIQQKVQKSGPFFLLFHIGGNANPPGFIQVLALMLKGMIRSYAGSERKRSQGYSVH